MRSVLITGGTGFFGRAFVHRLLGAPHQFNQPVVEISPGGIVMLHPAAVDRICVLSRCEHRQALMREDFADDERLRFFVGDVRDRERLERAMDGCDVVIHAAALKRIEVGHYNPDEMVKTNVLGVMNVISAAHAAHVERAIFLSSDKAFEPVSPYGQSKAMGESLFLAANRTHVGTRFTVTRYGNVAGSTGSVIPRWRRILSAGRRVPVSDPECTRFWMSVDEAVNLVLNTLEAMPEEIAIPELPGFRLGDLAGAMDAEMDLRGLGRWEKRHESMRAGLSSDRAPRLTIDDLRERLNHVPA